MHFLVTGGYGFIGSHVVDQLVELGHQVTVFDIGTPSPIVHPVLDSIRSVQGDVRDPVPVFQVVAEEHPDCIIHLAALLGRESERNPNNAVSVNIRGTTNVLEAARTFSVPRVIAASSAAVYGTVSNGIPSLDELTPTDPSTIYGVTKLACEHLGSWYGKSYDFDCAFLRPVHGLGPDRQRGNVDDAYIIKSAVAGRSITVPHIEHPFEIIAVQDEAAAFVTVATADTIPNKRYVVGSGSQITLPAFAELVADIVPEATISIGAARGDDTLMARPPADPTLLHTDFGWEPTYSIEETIEAYVEWLSDNPHAWTLDDAPPWQESQ